MRKISILVVCLCFSGQFAYGQGKPNAMGISLKSLFMDYQSQNGGDLLNFSKYHYGFEVGCYKRLTSKLELNIPIKIGVVNKYDDDVLDRVHKKIYGIDGQLQYNFYAPNKKIVPYILSGVGVVTEVGQDFNVQIPVGLGFKIAVSYNAYINYQGEYRFSLAEGGNNLHHGIGFTYYFGGKLNNDKNTNDKDGDGVVDDEDLCPELTGLVEHKGCPDTDGDGVPDYKDKCENVIGLPELNGCPDTDGDGVIDPEDKCPNEAGTKEDGCPEDDPNKLDTDGDGVVDAKDKCPNEAGVKEDGCPEKDTDGDGVPDSKDRCPNEVGTVATNGCPDTDGDGIIDLDDKCPSKPGSKVYNGCPDTDGDGIHDGRDRCPNSFGSVAKKGCPEIKKEDKRTLDIAMRAVQFDTGRSTLKPESYAVLKQIADIMRRYPDFNLTINGHTDNTGKASVNQVLSERRAEACYRYLIRQGISDYRMSYVGYGESRPISNNQTLRGRTLNRRVEFNLVPAR